jgi:hypothetical protein
MGSLKKLLSLVILIINSFYTAAQNPSQYLDSTSTWYEVQGGFFAPGYNYINHNKYYFDNDTTISGNNYYQLYWDQIDSTWNSFTGAFIAVNYNNHIYQGALREDSLKRFFIIYQSQSTESLLFDFNLTIGDSLPDMVANYGCNNPPATVTNIDTLFLGAQALQHFYLPPGLLNKTLYEGIGSSGGFIWYGSLCQMIETGACLIAYKKGADSLYINCGQAITGISENRLEISSKIFPNPASQYITIVNASRRTFRLYNSVGSVVLETKLSENHTTGQVNISMLSNGIYFWQILDVNGVFENGKLLIIH